ncbi:hypothetical protein R3P38DRAFT_2400225, partial [Favolaschia claudopus]
PMATIPHFTGNREVDATSAEDFLKDARIYFRAHGIKTDEEKLTEVGDRFRSASPADVWFKALKATVWADFQTAFVTRFERGSAIVKPQAQLLAELSSMRITVEELAREVPRTPQGWVVKPLGAFVERVEDAVISAGAGAASEGVWAFHSSLPNPLRIAVGDAPANWDDLLVALKKIPEAAVVAAIDQYRYDEKTRAMEEKLDRLTRQMSGVRLSAPTPSAPIGVAAAGAGATGGGVGNAVREGGGGGGRNARVRGGSEAEKEALRRVLAEVLRRRRADTAEGRVQYNADVASWNARNGGIPPDRVAIDTTGYPLRPGTADPCSGECWTCGMRTSPRHDRNRCTAPALHALEKRFRMVCGMWLGTAAEGGQAGVNFMGVAGTPWWGGDHEGGGAACDGQRDASLPGLLGGAGSTSCVFTGSELQLVDLYTVDPSKNEKTTAAFMHWISMEGPRGERVRVRALWDGGAQVSVLDRGRFEEVRHRLGETGPGRKMLRMADGTRVPSIAHWEGEIEVADVWVHGEFEVFDSGGGWSFLFGKDLQAAIGAVHDMRKDMVTVESRGKSAVLKNHNPAVCSTVGLEGIRAAARAAATHEAHRGVVSSAVPPARGVFCCTVQAP